MLCPTSNCPTLVTFSCVFVLITFVFAVAYCEHAKVSLLYLSDRGFTDRPKDAFTYKQWRGAIKKACNDSHISAERAVALKELVDRAKLYSVPVVVPITSPGISLPVLSPVNKLCQVGALRNTSPFNARKSLRTLTLSGALSLGTRRPTGSHANAAPMAVVRVVCAVLVVHAQCSLFTRNSAKICDHTYLALLHMQLAEHVGFTGFKQPESSSPESDDKSALAALHRAQADHLLDSCHIPQEPSPSMVAKLNNTLAICPLDALCTSRESVGGPKTRGKLSCAHIFPTEFHVELKHCPSPACGITLLCFSTYCWFSCRSGSEGIPGNRQRDALQPQIRNIRHHHLHRDLLGLRCHVLA